MYHVDCVCGVHIVTPAKVGICRGCGRKFELIWPVPIENWTKGNRELGK